MISLETAPVSPLPPRHSTHAPNAVVPSSARPTFASLLEGFTVRIDGGEALVQNAAAGSYAGMDAGRLIALQAGIYRYSEAIELGAKLVDRAASSVRAVLQAGH